MGKCTNCGHKAILLDSTECRNCGKEICDKCGIYMFKLWDAKPNRNAPLLLDAWYVCSEKCLHNFSIQIANHMFSSGIGFSQTSAVAKLPFFVKETLVKSEHAEHFGKEFNRLKSKPDRFRVNFSPLRDLGEQPKARNLLWEKLVELASAMVTANHKGLLEAFEKAGRYEEAAQECEKLGMLEKAGELRRMARTTYVVSASFDIRKDGGIAVRCPSCGASQSLESKSNEITCGYCGKQYFVPKRVLDML